MQPTVNKIRSTLSRKHYRFWQEMGLLLGRPMGKPNEVWLKVTHRCKTQCMMCEIWKTPSRLSEELSIPQWKAVLTDLRAWLGPSIVWFTGGEAFAKKDVVDLFSHSARIGLFPRVITRGVGVYDEHTAREILASGLDEYHVSIESLDPQVHDLISPPKGTLAKAIAGIECLNRLRRTQQASLRIVIKTIIMGLNRGHILPIVDWAIAQGLDEIKFQPLEQNIEQQEEDIMWFQHSKLWPQHDTELHEVLGVIDQLITHKQNGAPIHNNERELLAMKRYFMDPVGMYRPVKDHILSTTGTVWESNDGWMEIWHNGNVHTSWKNPPIGNVLHAPISRIWYDRPTPPRVVRLFGLLR